MISLRSVILEHIRARVHALVPGIDVTSGKVDPFAVTIGDQWVTFSPDNEDVWTPNLGKTSLRKVLQQMGHLPETTTDVVVGVFPDVQPFVSAPHRWILPSGECLSVHSGHLYYFPSGSSVPTMDVPYEDLRASLRALKALMETMP